MTDVLDVLRTAGRLLWRHWPVLLALYLGAILARYGVIEFAGWIGSYSAVAGSLLLPIAILVRLIALVAMFLVLRDGMRQLRAIAPLPADGPARRREFVDALMVGILPFFAFYAAWGYLREDAVAYSSRVLELTTGRLFDDATVGDGLNGMVTVTPLTIAIVIAAFVLRWLLQRYRDRLPRWFGVFAAYLEAVWVYFAAVVIGDIVATVSNWVATRQGMVWLGDLRAGIESVFLPFAWLWSATEWLLGEVGGIILLPVAWLTIAGVLYGQAVAPAAVSTERIAGDVGRRIRTHYRNLPGRLRARLEDLWSDLVGRFTPIGNALVLMWRAGPVLIGGFVLTYTLLLWLQGVCEWAVPRAFGPHDSQFWFVNDQLIFLIVPVLIEPVRIALVAGGYDGVIGRLRGRQAGASDRPEALDTAQGSTTALTNSGLPATDSSSTTNGPEASSGTR
ncbi:hypothetical protein [Microbacterium kyungheense]|uniref:Uncharacterized protein n=1 Tax=Microbacterium kyungheense TaxID=1263636 RepID=A0A543EQ11_9MICO|nr:hypothetical protein [Microbacterium kyungheense]TQM23673.1 hypothetical protein FB391_3063 [Microbacterium kyungheense]